MKIKNNLLVGTVFLSLALGAASCTIEMEQLTDSRTAPMSVQVANQIASRGLITTGTLPADDYGIGVTLVNKSDKAPYDGQTGSDEMKPYDPWDYVENGVYAVTMDGNPVTADKANNTCVGIALVQGSHKFMIAKADATDGTNATLYWGKNLKGKVIEDITNLANADGINSYGYLGGTSTPQLEKDFTKWDAGALSDYNGKNNTEAIKGAYNEYRVEMIDRDMCSVLETFNASDNYNDWYVPTCGQLALMYLNMNEINTTLAKIGGTELKDKGYLSSSEMNESYVWYVMFYNGDVATEFSYKDFLNNHIRFIRDITLLVMR